MIFLLCYTTASALVVNKCYCYNCDYYYWQSADMTSLFDGDYCYSVTPKVIDMSRHGMTSQPKSTVHPRLATIFHVAVENKEYLGKQLYCYSRQASAMRVHIVC